MGLSDAERAMLAELQARAAEDDAGDTGEVAAEVAAVVAAEVAEVVAEAAVEAAADEIVELEPYVEPTAEEIAAREQAYADAERQRIETQTAAEVAVIEANAAAEVAVIEAIAAIDEPEPEPPEEIPPVEGADELLDEPPGPDHWFFRKVKLFGGAR